jgi:lipopolysaccharide/colanic/teichoic acid biosynthesis glycosyltransferase
MIQEAPTSSGTADHQPKFDRTTGPRIWGLDARQLHDAYWHARGVQCIRRGMRADWQRGAELYLLIEPDQLVAFDIRQISDRLTWHNALVTRLRLTHEHDNRYSERVLIDEDGYVERIERRYRPRFHGSSRVTLTSKRRIASIWMTARTRREGWDRVRRAVPFSRVDHWKCPGITFTEGDPSQERHFTRVLLESWTEPGRGIEGITESPTGVWHRRNVDLPTQVVHIGPLWIGDGYETRGRACVVGPSWINDNGHAKAVRANGDAVHVKDIMDIELTSRPQNARTPSPGVVYAMCKRISDIIVSFTALLVFAPIMLCIGLCVLVEDGWPIFFAQERQGRGGRSFKCLKFRTMQRNAEQMAAQLSEMNVCDGPQVYIKNDPRVTRIGHILRVTHLDELPQLFNVFVGQMSLVGPRPSPDRENQMCPAWRDVRLSVRPGMTGLWQLKRRREPGEDFQEWIKYDIEYVQNASFLLDMRIVIHTIRAIISRSRGGKS